MIQSFNEEELKMLVQAGLQTLLGQTNNTEDMSVSLRFTDEAALIITQNITPINEDVNLESLLSTLNMKGDSIGEGELETFEEPEDGELEESQEEANQTAYFSKNSIYKNTEVISKMLRATS